MSTGSDYDAEKKLELIQQTAKDYSEYFHVPVDPSTEVGGVTGVIPTFLRNADIDFRFHFIDFRFHFNRCSKLCKLRFTERGSFSLFSLA